MSISNLVSGIQHIGIPTNDIQKTISFYQSLGFAVAFRTADKQVAFLQIKNLVIETYQTGNACGKAGAIDHVCLDVTDIEAAFAEIKAGNYEMLDKEIQFLPFWENGVKFFNILGPNSEKIEFGQKL